MRRKIAVLAAQVDEATQKRFLTNFIEKSYEYDYDICLFTMHQKYQETEFRDVGDSNIFELINYALFDAVVLIAETILTPGLMAKLQDKIRKEFDGPVLVIDQENEFFGSVMMDHYSPVKKIIDHLIEVHGYKDIAFLGGKEGHPHSVQRLNAFMDSMQEHGLSVREDRVYHGNFWYDSGERFVDIMLEDRYNLPEALACANDVMAVGAATRFEEKGIRIPEDIAITGYDLTEEGISSPAPITTAHIPADECGVYAANWIHEEFEGLEHSEFISDAPLVMGSSCGCEYEAEMVPKALRDRWRTCQSTNSVFSGFNHIMEDLMTKYTVKSFLQVVSDYTYQISPFKEFHICLNDGFLNPASFVGENARRKGYPDTMYHVIECYDDPDMKDMIHINKSFKVKDLFPGLNEDRDYPTTYIFSPVFFEDRCFGYSVLNYGKQIKLYEENFRIWIRHIMHALEANYRQAYVMQLVERIKADQIRDSFTGLYNYDGFIRYTEQLSKMQTEKNKKLAVLVVDVRGIRQLNDVYGRDYGEKAIAVVGRHIQSIAGDDEVCCRMCNDEFLVSLLDDENGTRSKTFAAEIHLRLRDYKLVEGSDYELKVYTECLVGSPENLSQVEAQVNQVVSIKNYKKNHTGKKASEEVEMLDQIKNNQKVMKILDQNLLVYYYQPIVYAADGEIFAYEALMRCEEEKISPFQIIQSATFLDRLSDVERLTLLNVTEDVENNIDLYGKAKVFINSLPGIELSEKDDSIFSERVLRNKHRFVIEFTEESELTDEKLAELKEKYKKLKLDVAIDDYGTGYSNVNNLIRYMPSYVKIDRSLISEIHMNPQKQHFVKNIVEFAHDNGIDVLAEGVETREELHECLKHDIDLIQGYYIGRPARVPISEIDDSIRKDMEQIQLTNRGWRV